jgi:hypothetical protein
VAETDQISDIMDDLVGDNDLYIGTANVQWGMYNNQQTQNQ